MRPEQDPDPVVTRVRRAREALARACDYDFQKMFEFFKTAAGYAYSNRSRGGMVVRMIK